MCLQEECNEPHRLPFPYPFKEIGSYILPGKGTKETRKGGGDMHCQRLRSPTARHGVPASYKTSGKRFKQLKGLSP
jgi:hypothetical protein